MKFQPFRLRAGYPWSRVSEALTSQPPPEPFVACSSLCQVDPGSPSELSACLVSPLGARKPGHISHSETHGTSV